MNLKTTTTLPYFELPKRFLHVHYDPLRIPGIYNQADLTLGANCQVFAYELLSHFRLTHSDFPAFRSSELWDDSVYTETIETQSQDALKSLDLMLYNKTQKAYGAHVGLYVGNQQVLHLSKDIGYPAVQQHSELLLEEKYRCFIGAKRKKRRLFNEE